MSISLCCCNSSATRKIRFGLVRHRRWGFIPRFALFDPFRFVGADIAALAPGSTGFFDVFGQLDVTVEATFSWDPALNRKYTWSGTIARKGGGFSQSASQPGIFDSNGNGVGAELSILPGLDFSSSGTSISAGGTAVSVTTTHNNPDGSYSTMSVTRSLSKPVLIDDLRNDTQSLLDAIDLSTLPEPADNSDVARVAEFDQNGDIRLTDFVPNPIGHQSSEAHLAMPESWIARSSSGFKADNVPPGFFNPYLYGIAPVWAGWTLNPEDIEPESPFNSWPPIYPGDQSSWYPTSLTGATPIGVPQPLDRFDILAGKAWVTGKTTGMYARQTLSRYASHLAGDTCAILGSGSSASGGLLIGGTDRDIAKLSNATSLMPWATFSEGAFLQVSNTPC